MRDFALETLCPSEDRSRDRISRGTRGTLHFARVLLLVGGLHACGGAAGDRQADGGPAVNFTLQAAQEGEGNICLDLADGVTIDVVPGPEFGPFWRDAASHALSLPPLSIPVGETGSAIVDIHIRGYIAAAPPPGGLPISSGDAYGMEIKVNGTSAVTVRMSCTDSDGDGLEDIEEDCNHNGRVDRDSPQCQDGTVYETDPSSADTDGGGIPDGDEREHLTDPLNPDDDLALYGMYPRVVCPGDEVVIAGRGFSRSLFDNVVRFDGTAAQNVSIDPYLRHLTVRVPDAVKPEAGRSNSLTVEVSGQTSAPLSYLPGGTVLATIPVGDRPNNVLVSPDSGRAYIVNGDSRDLSVVDLDTLEEITGPGGPSRRISLGDDPLAMDITRDGSTLYVTNRLSNDVTPVDCFGLTAAAPNIPVGPEPWDVVMLRDRPRAYVANYGAHVYGCVSVLDTASHTRVTDLDFPPDAVTSAHAVEMALTPDGKQAWLVHDPEHHIYKIDTSNEEVLWSATVLNACTEGRKLTFSPDGNFAYLIGPGQSSTGVTNLSEVPVRNAPVWLDDGDCFPARVPILARDMVMVPGGNRLYIGSQRITCPDIGCNIGTVFAVDPGLRQGATVLTTYSVTDLAISPDGRRLHAADTVQDMVHILDTASDTVVAAASVQGDMDWPTVGYEDRAGWRQLHRRRMALSPDGSKLVTANALSDDVSVLAVQDPLPFRITTIPQTAAMLAPGGLCCDRTLAAFSPDGLRAYSTADSTHNLNIIDTRTHRVLKTVDFLGFIGERGDADCPQISQVAVSPDGASVFCWFNGVLCGQPWQDLLARVDAGTGAITAALWTDCSAWLGAPVYPYPAGQKLYFFNPCHGELDILDSLTLERKDTVALSATRILFHPFEPGKAYLVQEGGIVLIDPRTDTLLDADGDPGTTGPDLPDGISRIEVGAGKDLCRMRFSPDARTLYAVGGQGRCDEIVSDEILIVDLSANRLARTFKPQGRPRDLIPCPTGRKLYVITGGAPEVQMYETRSFQFVGRVPVGSEIEHLELTPDGGHLLLATKTTLHVMDTASDQLVASLPVCGQEETIAQVAISPDGSLAYVTFNPQESVNPDRSAAGIAVIRLPATSGFD